MKIAYIIWATLIIGSLYTSSLLFGLEKEVASQTEPPFNYIEFEMPEDRAYSKKLFASIHDKGMTAKVQESLEVDFYYIFLYVGSAILGAFLLLKNLNVERRWIYFIVGALGITAGVCDYIENGNLEILLNDWNVGAMDGAVEKAKKFAQIKFAIILPFLVSVLLGWVCFLIKKFILKR